MAEVNNPELEVWIDVSFIEKKPIKIGHLKHDRGNVRFNYDEVWLSHPQRFDIDPDLSLDNAIFHPNPAQGNFGVFLDSSPDRWGQTLMKRREAMEAKDEGRQARTLYAWDYLIGVQDQTRQGALRFKYPGTDVFLASHDLSAPPVAQLAELENVAKQLSDKNIDDLDNLRRWLRVLVAPGASLGGARPKANFTQKDGSLWIAKFPSAKDEKDAGAWEMVLNQLAANCGIQVPEAKIQQFSSKQHTFMTKRFDRIQQQRIHFASAMTLLGLQDGVDYKDNISYLNLAEFIIQQSASAKEDLEQLWRRILFNILVSNTDDHLRNHGFILTNQGWRLSPAYDMNPNEMGNGLTLNISENSNEQDISVVMHTAIYYQVKVDTANKILEEMQKEIANWRVIAKKFGISNSEIELTKRAFRLV